MVIFIGFLAFLATYLGGVFALKFKDKLHLILGFSAGAVIAVAFFDLIPEAVELGEAFYSIPTMLSITAVGFFGFMILDRFVIFHSHDEHVHEHAGSTKRGLLGAGSLSIHSFLDGLLVGLAFQVSSAVGLVVTSAVLVHDFSDGINTVNLILKNNGNVQEAKKWLMIDALAPIAGVVATLFFTLPQNILGIILAVFSGFFLYIGASDLLPESHHNHPTIWTTIATLVGAGVLFSAIQVAGI
ncbi:ZIP family metal transporter [Candidatus Nomurabacteria bacterium]|jgi:zinc transporter ZupT|nr:MAG: ZIP family metal transporter [Candidatus Nomurabacteria bacterium]